MSDPWSEAIAEAYASAPADETILDTLELRHAALVDEEDNPAPIRVVRDTRDWTLKLEEGAPLNAGAEVAFARVMFDVDLPDSSDGVPVARLSIATVNRQVIAAMELIVTVRAPIEVTYRAYLAPAAGDPAPEPSWVIGGLQLRGARVDEQRMTGDLTFDVLGNRAFPRWIYTRREFPGLAR